MSYVTSPVETSPSWTWSGNSVVYPFGTPTKSGIMPEDLRNFCGVPLARRANPPVYLTDQQLIQTIRYAEDRIESKTGVLLCPTSVASPPALTLAACTAAAIIPHNGIGQVRGVVYDLQDRGYDFRFDTFQDEAWGILRLRYKPLRILDGSANAIKL